MKFTQSLIDLWGTGRGREPDLFSIDSNEVFFFIILELLCCCFFYRNIVKKLFDKAERPHICCTTDD